MNKALVLLIILVVALKWGAVAWLLMSGHDKITTKVAPIG